MDANTTDMGQGGATGSGATMSAGGSGVTGQGGSTGVTAMGGSATTDTSGTVTGGGASGTTTMTGSGGAMGGATGAGGMTSSGGTLTAGGTSNAGASGAAGAAGAGSGSGGAASSSALISDDFESVAAGGPPDAAIWQLRVPGGNSIEVSTEQAHAGSQSVKVTGSSGSTMLFTEEPFPLPGGVIHFRVWMRFTDADWSGHNAFVESSPGQESQEVRFGGQNGAYHANLAADGDGLSPDPFEFPECSRCVAPVADQWACLRGKFDFANNAAELYVDDALAVDSAADGWHSGNGTFPQAPTEIGFGWALYGAVANTVFYDDLAIGYEPIACE